MPAAAQAPIRKFELRMVVAGSPCCRDARTHMRGIQGRRRTRIMTRTRSTAPRAIPNLRRFIMGCKLVIADDHRLMVAAIRTALEDERDIEIGGEPQAATSFSRSSVVPRPTSC